MAPRSAGLALLWLALAEGFASSSSRRCDVSLRVAAEAEASLETKVESTTITTLHDEAGFDLVTGADEGELVVVKFFAPWCRACRGLEPKYKRLSVEYSPKKVRFFEMSHKEITANNDGVAFLARAEVNVLPLIHFYAAGKRVEAFPCGPRKIELLREKLENWHGYAEKGLELTEAASPAASPPAQGAADPEPAPAPTPEPAADNAPPSVEDEEAGDRVFARAVMARVPLLGKLNSAQLDALVAGARMARYAPGDTLIAEGDMGRRFFVMIDGECDVYEAGDLESAGGRMPGFSPNAMRTVFGMRINMLSEGAYFGERALVTNEPRAASIVAVTEVRALAVDRSALAKVDRMTWGEKLGDEALNLNTLRERLEISANFEWGYERSAAQFSADAASDASRAVSSDDALVEPRPRGPGIDALTDTSSLSVMQRLRLIRSVVRAFDQAAARTPSFGDPAEKAYRAGLVAQLTVYQVSEFEQTFSLLDRNGDGFLGIEELANLMRAVGRTPSEEDLRAMMNKANPEIDGNDMISSDDFLALMAQAEFSSMFLEAFKLLDPDGLGWVESELLWRMMNTLVPSDARSPPGFLPTKIDELIDTFGVNDGHIDYQAFVKIMMTGR